VTSGWRGGASSAQLRSSRRKMVRIKLTNALFPLRIIHFLSHSIQTIHTFVSRIPCFPHERSNDSHSNHLSCIRRHILLFWCAIPVNTSEYTSSQYHGSTADQAFLYRSLCLSTHLCCSSHSLARQSRPIAPLKRLISTFDRLFHFFSDLLGVDPGAGDDQIKKAYRKKALRAHPDK
jgi:hypothetical protein